MKVKLLALTIVVLILLVSPGYSQSNPETSVAVHTPNNGVMLLQEKQKWAIPPNSTWITQTTLWGGWLIPTPTISGTTTWSLPSSIKAFPASPWDQHVRFNVDPNIRSITWVFNPNRAGASHPQVTLTVNQTDSEKWLQVTNLADGAEIITFGDNKRHVEGDKIPLSTNGSFWSSPMMALVLSSRNIGDNTGRQEFVFTGAHNAKFQFEIGLTILSKKE